MCGYSEMSMAFKCFRVTATPPVKYWLLSVRFYLE
ncbi:hypothetical protein BVRB_3g064710 [Beta vulgaris subsp. vulgaris]|nr:hypothetical protein BVRB_3g064710 [Beta vulgaris subsp. vulgaris]